MYSRWPVWLPTLLLLGGLAAENASVAVPAGTAPVPGQGAGEIPRGLQVLYDVPMQSFSLTRELFMGLWQRWPEGAERLAAQELAATGAVGAAALYSMLLDHYGLHLDPRRGSDVPAAFSTPPFSGDEREGPWTMNCLVCHGGSVEGRFYPGLPNSTLMLEALVTDIVAAKRGEHSGLEDGMVMAQMGHTIGTSEATLFGEILLRFREPNLDLKPLPGLVRAGSANMTRLASVPDGLLALDAPAWWQLRHKTHMYLDHSVEKNHRTVMQFTLGLEDMTFKARVKDVVLHGSEAEVRRAVGRLVAEVILPIRERTMGDGAERPDPEAFLRLVVQALPTMSLPARFAISQHVEPAGIHGDRIRGWDDEFRDIFTFIDELEPPAYPGEIDVELAETGRELYRETCARCHGHHDGSGPPYVSKRINHAVIGTDALYPAALDQDFRDRLVGFLTERPGGGQIEIVRDAVADEGYVAPPLQGVWASAPYLHNGSVPTVDHLLDYERRMQLEDSGLHAWVVEDPDAYDHDSLGLRARFLSRDERTRRLDDHRVRDSRRRGMGAGGHDFGEALEPDQRRAIIEYLKTL